MLKTKKSLALVLTAVVFAGCTSVAPQVTSQNNNNTKVEAVKVEPVVDLGEKNGASAKLNLRFNRDSKFGIKNVVGFASANINSKAYLVVKLHKVVPPASMVSPDVRFENPATLATFIGLSATPTTPELTAMSKSVLDGSLATITGFSPFIVGANTATLKFNGLHFGSNYYVSARAYTPANVDGGNLPVNFPAGDAKIDIAATTGAVTIAASGTYAHSDFSLLQINKGDIITDAVGKRWTVSTTPTAGTFNVVDFETNLPPTSALLTQSFNLWRNVVSSDGSSAANGGGTQGAVGAPSTEEFISVSPTGVVSITNDANTNTALDLNIQLRSDFVPQATQVNGNLTVTAGNTANAATETITSP